MSVDQYGRPYNVGGGGGDDLAFVQQLVANSKGKAQKKGSGLFGFNSNPLHDIFSAISVPLHAVTSTGVTAGRIAGALGGQDYGSNGPSLGNWWDMIAKPEKAVDFGDVVSGNPEKGLTVGVFKGASAPGGSLVNWNAPTPVRIAAGFAGDVALDPLSYIAPAGEVHGAAEAAGHITEAASKQIAEELLPATGGKMTRDIIHEILTKSKPIDEIVKVPPEVALRVEEIRNAAQDAVFAARRGGASALDATQLERFGNYTNDLGKTRTLEKGLKLDFGKLGHIDLTSGEGPLSQLSVMRHKAQMQLGDMILGKAGVARGLGKLNGNPELNALARSGAARRTEEAPISMMDATLYKRLRGHTRLIVENAAKDAQRTTFEAIKGHTSEEINQAHEIIDTGGAAAATASPRVQELAQKLSDAFEQHGQQLVKAGVLDESELLKAGSYFPSPITKDAREALVAAGLHPEAGGVANNVRSFVEGQRKLWDPKTGKGGVGQDTETTARVGFTAKTRAEAEVKAGKIVGEQLKKTAELDTEAGKRAKDFIAAHPEAMDMLDKGSYPLFQEGREALLSQTRAIGRRAGQAYAGRRLFEAGYGLVDPRFAKGFVDYGPTSEEVQRMLRLGGEASSNALDRQAAARETELAIKEMGGGAPPEGGAGGISSVRPPEGPVGPFDFRGSEAAGEARLATPTPAPAAEAAVPAAAPTAAANPIDAARAEGRLPTMDEFLAGAPQTDVVGQVQAETARKIQAIEQALPPKAEGEVRLYNHGNTNWWTPDVAYVAPRGDIGDMRYLDVTQNEARALDAASQAAPGERGFAIDETVNPELSAVLQRAEPIPTGEAAAAAPAAPASLPQVATNVGRVAELDRTFAEKGWHVTGDMPETAKRIVVTGGRDADHPGATRLLIQKLKAQYGEDITIVHGDARGVDKNFARIAQEEGVAVEAHPANWKPNGPQGALDRGAGFKRNAEMAQSGPDLGIVFPGGKGTAHMSAQMDKAGIPKIVLGPGRPEGGGAKAVEAAVSANREAVARTAVIENMNHIEGLVDNGRAFLAEMAKSAKAPQAVLRDAKYEAGLDQIISDLHLEVPKTLGTHDVAETLPIPGFTPTGGAGKSLSTAAVAERIGAKRRVVDAAIKDFTAHPDVYAAKVRSHVEGQLAEQADKARVGVTLPDTKLVPERRVPWTYEEKQAHEAATATVKALGGERGQALQDVKKATTDLQAITARGPRVVSQDARNVENDLLKYEGERTKLKQAFEAKKQMDEADAARTAEQHAYERPVGGTEDLSGDNLQTWADKNVNAAPEGELTGEQRLEFEREMKAWRERQGLPIADDTTARYLRENRQMLTTKHPKPELMTDKMVNLLVERQLAELDHHIEQLDLISRLHAPGEPRLGPVTDADLAKARVEDSTARLHDVNGRIEEAKAGLPPKGATDKLQPSSGKQVTEVVEGSPYDQALKDFHAQIAKRNARAVEPHLESREQWNIGDAPFRDQETGLTIKEGTLSWATEGINPDVVKARADKIRADWQRMGQTYNDHVQMRDAFAAYQGELGKHLQPTVENAMVGKAVHQVDQVGRLAQSPAHVDAMVDDLVGDAQAVQGVATSVIPEQVQVNVEQRATEAAAWKAMSEEGRANGEAARAEIAHMRLTAAHLANDADMYRANAREWLSEWHSITEERKLHTAVNSLLVQGQFDWLAHTSLQRGILTPQAAADAIQYTERLATPEGQNRLAESWRRALHWMRVWQITSPGFHVRNLFGGVFNNALAGTDAASYVSMARLWRKASTPEGLAALSPEDRKMWSLITSIQSPGQISSEAIGNPASRIMGEAAMSHTPWGQLGTHGALPRLSEHAGSNVEFYLRSTLAYDTLKKGGSLDSAVEAINKFHFDYHDASAKEQWLKANAIPFLTWTRHNVPLQLQMLVENPRPYARFTHFQREVESRSTADKVIPGYFSDISAVRLPWQMGGGHNYYVPDLPFRDLGLVSDPIHELAYGQGDLGQRALAAFGEPVSQTTPLISGPVEWLLGKQFYKGIPLHGDRGIKLHDLHIPEWLAAPLRLTPLVKRGKNGQSYITERDFYIIEKVLPVLGRARRLGGSSETKQQDKLMSHLISFFAGTQIRENTLDDQKIANYISSLETKRKKSINNGLRK